MKTHLCSYHKNLVSLAQEEENVVHIGGKYVPSISICLSRFDLAQSLKKQRKTFKPCDIKLKIRRMYQNDF